LPRLGACEPREQVPVLFGTELLDLALAIGHEFERDRLRPAGTEAAPHLVPEQRADLVADEAIEHTPRPLGRDHLLVDRARMVQGLLNRLLRDLVEREPMDFPFPAR